MLELPDRRRALLLVGQAGARATGPPGRGSPGWFNFLGQVAVTAGIDFGAAFFLNALLDLQFDFSATPGHTIFLFGLILVAHGLLNTFGVRLVARLNDISVWWHILGVLIIVGALVILPDSHQSADFVFTEFVNNTGWGSSIYVVLLGLLLAQYTFTGYDASAHMTEETHDAAVTGPRGIVMSILVSLGAGWVLLIGVTFAIQSYDGALGSATGVPPAQIFIDAIGETGGKLLLVIVFGAQFFCGMSSVTANSRMVYAFARDGALPASGFWHRLNKRTRTPTNAIWLAAVGAFLLGLPYLWNTTAYAAVTSIAVIGLYIAYVMPTLLRLRQGDDFVPGPGTSGAGAGSIGMVAVAWVAFITVLFMLPQVSPVSRTTFNYTPIAVLWSCSASPGSGGWCRPASGTGARRSRAHRRSWPRSKPTWVGVRIGRAGAGAHRRAAARAGRGRQHRHGAAGHGRHAGTAAGQAVPRPLLPRRGAAPRGRGVQLPAGGGRRHEHRRRLRHVVVGAGLRRLRAAARPGHAPPSALARGHGPRALRRASGRTARRSRPRPARCCAASSTGWPSGASWRTSAPSWS